MTTLTYQVGVSRIYEPVISSHFMHRLASDPNLSLYSEMEYADRSLPIDSHAIYDRLLPSLLQASNAFSAQRASAAKERASSNFRKYGLQSRSSVGLAHQITEVMFDRQYRADQKETCSRQDIGCRVQNRINSGLPIEMVIPALPFKIPSPLKARGPFPDLSEVNFILCLYEIAATVDLIYRSSRPGFTGTLAKFTVVSDGTRFNRIIGHPDALVAEYQDSLKNWVDRLGISRFIEIKDYCKLLNCHLPTSLQEAKDEIRRRSIAEYSKVLWPVFRPADMQSTLSGAIEAAPDPEFSHLEGRFIPLLKSLIYSIDYQSLRVDRKLSATARGALYRELTAHMLEPYPTIVDADSSLLGGAKSLAATDVAKEGLRQSMLREAWVAAIEYMAEIKSDRELPHEPILTCLPNSVRWTIHPKSGQLAIHTSKSLGIAVQPWAGSAVFKRTHRGDIRLSTLPVLALEGLGCIPVRAFTDGRGVALAPQPFFYIHPNVSFNDTDDFLEEIARHLIRRRVD